MSYDLLFRQAIELHQNGQFDEAEQIYRKILDTAPQQPDVLNLLGLIAQIKNVHQEAVNLFYQAIKVAPKHAPFYFNLGISLDNWGKPREALEAFNQAFKLNPELKEAQLFIGNIYNNSLDDKIAAQKAYNKALKIDPEYSEAQTRLAITYYPEETDKALSMLHKVLDNYPSEILAAYFLGIIYFDQKDLQKALNYTNIAFEQSPDDDDILTLLGQIYYNLKEFDKAYHYFSSAATLNPRNLDAVVNLANFETQNNKYDLAEYYYKSVIEIDPDHFNAHLNYANLLHLQKRLSESLEEYRKAIIINSKSAEASNNLGIILKELGDIEEALGLFFNAYSLNPDLEEISINISETLILYHKTSPEEALKIAQNWYSQAPNNVFAKHLVQSFKGEQDAETSEYAKKLFDNFADNYEATLEKIEYKLPKKIKEIIGETKGSILDLGCGSGLLGQELKNPQNQIFGVDISPKMLELAKEKNIYKELICSDILEFLKRDKNNYSLITAADVFCYIGDLTPIIKACNQQRLCFSVETSNDNTNYQIYANGRYKHSPQYVMDILKNYGYTGIVAHPVTLRLENGQEVLGCIYVTN